MKLNHKTPYLRMFKISFALALLFLSATTAFSQTADCFKFKEGKFRIADTRVGVVTIAERRGGYQTESSESLKAVVRFSITWQDNCSYTLKLDKVIRNENKIDFPSNLEIHVKIIATSGRSYTQQTSSSITNGTYNVEVVKLD
ncbi:hypothetical protein [Ferruginibacter sp. SUN106]|uniref:hypothetical protein n=1 Tax=Ferruginibacter sp. SUN106 TaxID=2978348 RepID=UPI003D3665DC